MANTRKDMDSALKSIVLTYLRARGFQGSLPHLRRMRGDAVDLICFQFSSAGGALVVELGRVSPDGFEQFGRHYPAEKTKVMHTRERHRLGSELRINYGDHWFTFAEADTCDVAREVVAELENPAVWALVDEMHVLGRDD